MMAWILAFSSISRSRRLPAFSKSCPRTEASLSLVTCVRAWIVAIQLSLCTTGFTQFTLNILVLLSQVLSIHHTVFGTGK